MNGPGNRMMQFWTPQNEAEFNAFMAFDPGVRQWRNAFTRRYGEAPQIEGGDFDYRQAYIAGNRPRPVPGDSVPHWDSRGKAGDHPTAWKEQFMQRFGVDPDTVTNEQVTPEMQQFIRGVLPR